MDADWWAKVRKARDGQMSDKPKPLTDIEVAHDAYVVGTALGELAPDIIEAGHRLVSELTRLRSDEWLRAAAEEIAADSAVGQIAVSGVLTSLRKHQDKA